MIFTGDTEFSFEAWKNFVRVALCLNSNFILSRRYLPSKHRLNNAEFYQNLTHT
jgi:hypothetical protein